MESRGRKVQVILVDGGILEGFVHSTDRETGRLSLEKVVNCERGKKLQGLQHFYEDEIEDVVVLEESKATTHSDDEKIVNKRGAQSVMKAKNSPAHLNKLRNFDPAKQSLRNQGGDGRAEDDDHLADNEVSNDVYTILAHLDNVFSKAIEFIRSHQVIGVALEGASLGRSGELCWIQIGTPSHVFLLDVLTLGVDCFNEGLREILENENILKVFHDCRMASDILYHQFKINVVNVFDTQVADVFVYRLRHHNDWPRFVTALAPCLSQHLDLSPEQVHWAIIRENFRKEDEEIWAERPMKKHVIEAAVKDVMYLLELRQVLMEKMLEEFVAGVNIYLSHVRDASLTDSEKYQSMKHLLPVAFQDIRRFMDSYRGRDLHTQRFSLEKDCHGFQENCAGIFQPDVNFSHDSLWHSGSVRRKENTVAEKSVSSRVIPETTSNLRANQMSFQPNMTNQDSLQSQGNKRLSQERKTSKRDSLESQGSEKVENYFSDTGAKSGVHEPVDIDNTELSGSQLMRALVYNQAGNTRESDSEIDNFELKPAGTLRGCVAGPKKQKIPPPSMANNQMQEPRREMAVSSVTSPKSYQTSPKSYQSDSSDRKSIHVKNSDRFLQDYKQFIKKGNDEDSDGSDCDLIPGGSLKQSQAKNVQKTNDQTENTSKSVPQYNFVPRGVLSQQEVECFNRQRETLDKNKGATRGVDDDSVYSDKTLSPEKEVKNGKLNPAKNGISLQSLLKTQEEFTMNGYHSSSSIASLASKDSTPVNVRMQALLDVIQKSQQK